MTAELALAIGAAGKKVPDPYLVARALGDGERRFAEADVFRLTGRLGVTRIVWGYAGHLRNNKLRLTIQFQDVSGDFKQFGPVNVRHFEDLPFSDEDPPIEVYRRLLPEVLKTIGIDSPTPVSPPPGSRFDSTAELPLSPLRVVSDRAEPARDAYYLQLLAALAPRSAERTRERLIEKSMLAIRAMSPASPDYRILKARAYMRMGLRPAALKTLGAPKSDEERHLHAMLNGNLPDVERYSVRIKPGIRAFIARLESNEIASAYGTRTQQKSLEEASTLNLSGQVWPDLAARAFTDWDTWSQHENGRLKVLLDREFPVAGFTAEGIVRGAASLGDRNKAQMALDLSVLDHVRRFSETQAASWCCAPVLARFTAPDYLDFLDNLGTDNLVRRAHLMAWTQGLPQAALEFLARIDSVYKDQPQLTVERARAELGLAQNADGASKDGLLKAAYEHALNAFYWEQGQTRNAAEAWELVNSTNRRDYGPFIENNYAADRPFRSFYPGWERGGDTALQIANQEAALRNSMFDFDPVTYLAWAFGEFGQKWDKVDQLLRSIDNRFAGNPERAPYLAKEAARKGDLKTAQRYYQEDIKSQPRRWKSYMDLGKILFEEGEADKAAKLFMSYPEFVRRSDENGVELSNHAFEAGSLFYWSGNLGQAMPLYRIAAGLRTGSDASMSSEIRISLSNGDYATALIGSLERGRRYNSQFGYRDYLGMLHAMGYSQEAWDAFDVLIGQTLNPQLWETPLVGHRIAGATEAEIAGWVARDAVRKSGYAGMYLLRAGVTDRIPTRGLASAIAAVERPVWKVEYTEGPVVRASVDGKIHRILNPTQGPPHSFLPPGVFDSVKKTPVKSDLVYFSEAYRAMRAGDFAGANRLFEEALALYDMRDQELDYMLPYYAFAAAKSGASGSVSARLDRFDVAYQRLDYHLARAAVSGLAGKTAESLRNLKLALHRRPFTESRPLYTEYQLAEICEWLYEATRNEKYRDLAVSWAKSVQAFSPWFAWPYAMEAKLSTDKDERSRAIAMAYYLDKQSERLATVPKHEIDAAVKASTDGNPFLKARGSAKGI
jgi:tetratricopeptide (TPR) repeat protein